MGLAELAARCPNAGIEEIFHPDHLVVLRDDDESVHLLLYVGLTSPGHYIHLKHVILGPEHGAMFVDGREPEPEPEPEPGPEPQPQPAPILSSGE